MLRKRLHGEEQPHIKLGMFKIRIPLIHSGWSWPEAFQGLLLVATPLGIAVGIGEMLGVPFELAILIILANNISYLLHPLLGDPVFPGAITPGIALTLAFGHAIPAGPERIQGIVALQLLVGAIFLFMGVTGLSKKIVGIVPRPVVAGILLGAGISSVTNAFTKLMPGLEIASSVGLLVMIVVMFSQKFNKIKGESKILGFIGKFGLIPGIIAAFIVGIIVNEVKMPVNLMKDGLFVPIHRFGELVSNYTVFGVGFPPASAFIAALPLAISLYIIAFSDIVFADTVNRQADEFRDDEKIIYNPSAANVISGLRNLVLGIFSPYIGICGPIFAGGQVAVIERYKQGRKEMDSIFDGIFPFIIMMTLGLIFMPVINFFKPILPLGLALTFVVQGFATSYMAMETVKSRPERGIAGLMAIILAARGAFWGLGAGIILYLLIVDKKSNEKAVNNTVASN